MQLPYDHDHDGPLPQNAIDQMYAHTDKAPNIKCSAPCFIKSCELNSVGPYKV